MKRLVSTLNLPKEDWLRYRKCGITGILQHKQSTVTD